MVAESHKIPKVLSFVVKNDLCIGCGLCVYKCPTNALEMSWEENGFLIPKISRNCDSDGACLDVCPFNPFPKDEVKTENEISTIFLEEAPNFHPKIGKYNGIYAGYSEEFRLLSSSGGLGTYICTQLLENKIVDHIFSVQESSKPGCFYEYGISSNKSDLLTASKTKYFPVTMSTIFSEIDKLQGKVAIVGVGCFIKGIRLAQKSNPKLKDKIPFLIGIICGGVKSSFFTEYLSSKLHVNADKIQKPEFRKKDVESTAFDYSFSCKENGGEEKSIKMRTLGDMWGTGLFKANACDFCDDVTTELADISLGDAWLDPYDQDGRGTNVIVTRSNLAEELINQGIKKNDLVVERLPLATFLASQQGSFNHRQIGMPARIKIAKNKGQLVPPKRFENQEVTIDFSLVQKQRMFVRKKSLEIWRNNSNAYLFDVQMKKHIDKLQFFTKIYHKKRNITNKKNRLIELIFNSLKLKHKSKIL